MGIVISQPLDKLTATINRVVSGGGRLSVKYPLGGWQEMTVYPAIFAMSLFGHLHGAKPYEDLEFVIAERIADVHP